MLDDPLRPLLVVDQVNAGVLHLLDIMLVLLETLPILDVPFRPPAETIHMIAVEPRRLLTGHELLP